MVSAAVSKDFDCVGFEVVHPSKPERVRGVCGYEERDEEGAAEPELRTHKEGVLGVSAKERVVEALVGAERAPRSLCLGEALVHLQGRAAQAGRFRQYSSRMARSGSTRNRSFTIKLATSLLPFETADHC
ncbi:hypothetical protein AURDEDRAFT_164306 [Auricularia subglabra TFB-10046 SS5]|nr:hypothetical protein AURDEDRAFT_164306 [Auricularia subglabra TFB-10046 SS5]